MSILNRTKPPALDADRVNQIRDDIDAFIDARVAVLKKTSPGVPELVLRNILTARSGGCQCIAFLHIAELDGVDEELKTRQGKAKL
jgi:hypothetical protein